MAPFDNIRVKNKEKGVNDYFHHMFFLFNEFNDGPVKQF